MIIRFIDSGPTEPYLNMAVDEAISILVRQDKVLPTLRFYEWSKPAITIGEFQKLEEINLSACLKIGIPILRRPTGGKGIFHYDDLTYSFSAKKEGIFRGSLFKTYEILSNIFAQAFKRTGLSVEIKKEKRVINRSSLCFARSSFGEISFRGQKIVGSAQKRWIDGFLQQGTIPINVNREIQKKIFVCLPEEVKNIYGIKELYPDFDSELFKYNLKQTLKDFGFEVLQQGLEPEELALAQELLEKKYRWIQ